MEEHNLANESWREAHRKLAAVVRKRPKKPTELKYSYTPCKECGAKLAYSDVGHNGAWECSKDLIEGTQEHPSYSFSMYSMKIDYEYTKKQQEGYGYVGMGR